MSPFAKRITFSAVAIPLVSLIFYLGDAALAILLGAAAGVAAWELFRLARSAGLAPLEEIGVPLAAAIPLLTHAHQLGVLSIPVVTMSVVGTMGIFALTIWRRGPVGHPFGATAATVFGVIYTGGTLSFAYALRYHEYAIGALAGMSVLLFPVVLTWTQDSAAFFVGRTLGRHKLIPTVSPGKTVEGAVGGLVFTIAMAWVCARLVLPETARLGFSPIGAIVFGIAISLAAQVGDLAESLLKREAGVKDSSTLIPGHGGVLDRLDSLFFVLPVAYLLARPLLLVAQ